MRFVGEKCDVSVVGPGGASPAQAFVCLLFPWKRALAREKLWTFARGGYAQMSPINIELTMISQIKPFFPPTNSWIYRAAVKANGFSCRA